MHSVKIIDQKMQAHFPICRARGVHARGPTASPAMAAEIYKQQSDVNHHVAYLHGVFAWGASAHAVGYFHRCLVI